MQYSVPMKTEAELSSELVTLAARLVRLVRSGGAYPAPMRVLAILEDSGPLTITALAKLDRCSQPTMSHAIATLEADHLVSRTTDPADARRVVITTTPAGLAALTEVRRGNGALVGDRVARAGLTAEQLSTAVTVLRGVLEKESND